MKAAIYSRKSKFSEKGESIENQIQMRISYFLLLASFMSLLNSGLFVLPPEKPSSS